MLVQYVEIGARLFRAFAHEIHAERLFIDDGVSSLRQRLQAY